MTDTFIDGEYLSNGERRIFFCARCGERVEMRTANKKGIYNIEPPAECARCANVRRVLGNSLDAAIVFAWVEGVIERGIEKHNEDGDAHTGLYGSIEAHERHRHGRDDGE